MVRWTIALLLPLVGFFILLSQSGWDGHWENHKAHFWLVFVVALVNAALGLVMAEAARRRADARVFLVGLVFLSTGGFLALHVRVELALLSLYRFEQGGRLACGGAVNRTTRRAARARGPRPARRPERAPSARHPPKSLHRAAKRARRRTRQVAGRRPRPPGSEERR